MFSQQQNLQYFYPIRPNNQRKYTDFCCVIIYSALSLTVILAFFYSYILEKQKNLFIPQDPSGRQCGRNQAANYPYIYFPSPFPESLDLAVCVKSCPDSTGETELNCLVNSAVESCKMNATDLFNRSNQFLIYQTKSNQFLSLCQPESKIIGDVISSKINTQQLLTDTADIYEAKYVIIFVCPGACITLMLLYLLLINVCYSMKPVFIGIIVSFFLLLGYLALYCFLTDTRQILSYSPIIGIIIVLGLIILLVYILAQRQYFMRGLDLINIGTQYVRDNCRLILMPLAMFAAWIILFFVELSVFIFIYAINTSESPNLQKQYSFPYLLNIQHDPLVIVLLILTFIHYIWTNLIIQHIGKFVSRVGAAFWIMHVPKHYKNALFSMFRFHIGSVILGSVLNTLFSWITDFLYFIMPDSNGRICCCTSIRFMELYQTQCFRKYLGYFTELTYIKIGLDGEQFIAAGYSITPLIVENTRYINQAYKMAKRIVQISQLLVAVLTTIICYLVIELSEDINGHILTNIIIFIISLLLSNFGFDAYDRAFEAILFTVIINKTSKQDPIERVGIAHFVNQGQEQSGKMKVYKQISNWYYHEKSMHLADKSTMGSNPNSVLQQNLN